MRERESCISAGNQSTGYIIYFGHEWWLEKSLAMIMKTSRLFGELEKSVDPADSLASLTHPIETLSDSWRSFTEKERKTFGNGVRLERFSRLRSLRKSFSKESLVKTLWPLEHRTARDEVFPYRKKSCCHFSNPQYCTFDKGSIKEREILSQGFGSFCCCLHCCIVVDVDAADVKVDAKKIACVSVSRAKRERLCIRMLICQAAAGSSSPACIRCSRPNDNVTMAWLLRDYHSVGGRTAFVKKFFCVLQANFLSVRNTDSVYKFFQCRVWLNFYRFNFEMNLNYLEPH